MRSQEREIQASNLPDQDKSVSIWQVMPKYGKDPSPPPYKLGSTNRPGERQLTNEMSIGVADDRPQGRRLWSVGMDDEKALVAGSDTGVPRDATLSFLSNPSRHTENGLLRCECGDARIGKS